MDKKEKQFPYRFFITTFVWSWTFWIFLILFSNRFLFFPFFILGAFGPLIGAITSVYCNEGKEYVKVFLKKFLDLRIGWKGFVMPILILGGCTFFAWILPELFGQSRLSMLLPSIWVFFPCLLFMFFLGGGQEEFGWRGYALPILEEKYGIWAANLILGIIWACWHLPLWFIEGTNQVYMNFIGFVILCIGYSYIFSWFIKISHNKPIAGIYAHGLANAFIPIMPVFVTQEFVPQPRYWIWVTSTLFIGIVITLFRKKNI
ncbi:MAG: type II CAAX endopeptidase family protein [Bacteroidales bacterium]|nr:type II CAAX endopeptidase family protein [Bacteroidales bacterium]MDD4030226.1 type II CAAX endopeptidase family protein [Bacteroidales bacterium]MDD4435136.1 type II CAAX endopeptidase family protein [Bacteroidales bacterium]